MAELHVIKPEDAAGDVIATIEAVLAKAKAGEISSVAIALVCRDGTTDDTWSQTPTWAALRGAVAHLGYRMDRKRFKSA